MKLHIDPSMILSLSGTCALPWQETRQIYYLEPDTILTIEDFTLEDDLTLSCSTPLANYLECTYCLSGEGSIEYRRESWPGLEESLPRHRIIWQPCSGQSFIKSGHPIKVAHLYFTPDGLTKYADKGYIYWASEGEIKNHVMLGSSRTIGVGIKYT